MFALDRLLPFPVRHQPPRSRASGSPRRRPALRRHLKGIGAGLLAACGIGIAALGGWLLAGGSLPSSELLVRQAESMPTEGGAPVHVETSPAGAQVRIDGTSVGNTPLDLRLLPGQHRLSLQHPEALNDEGTLQVPETGAAVDVHLWRRTPEVMPLRPVYPGASLLDARFLDDGQVALVVGLPSQPSASGASREVWRLDPATGQLARVSLPGVDPAASTLALAPEGDLVAYVTPGSSSTTTSTGWSTGGSAATATPQVNQPESVWVVALGGGQPPRRLFALPSISTPATSPNAEHIVDLVWTPDASRLVAVTRQPGPPPRARLFLLNGAAGTDSDAQPDAAELVLLPAEIVPGSAVLDPSGRWLALVTHAAVAPGGTNLVSLCVLQLQPGGTFRDLADLGSGSTPPTAAPVAWSPTTADEPAQVAFVGPVPAPTSGSGGLFGLFGALRPSAPPSGLFMADLNSSGLQDAQPRRLGTATGIFGVVWRSESTLFGFGRQGDGTLGLRSIDPTSGVVHDTGVRLPASTAQGAGGLSARWDTHHGEALVLAPAQTGSQFGGTVGGGSLRAWLVSFVSPRLQAGATQ